MADRKVMQKSTYQVGGLKGDHCRDRIEHTLSHLPGIDSVDVNINNNKVNVAYNPDVISSGYIEETLESLGYSIQG